jgi:hypothetical protein
VLRYQLMRPHVILELVTGGFCSCCCSCHAAWGPVAVCCCLVFPTAASTLTVSGKQQG